MPTRQALNAAAVPQTALGVRDRSPARPITSARRYRPSQPRVPAHERRVRHQNGLVALGAGGGHAERPSDQLGEPLEILARLGGQLVILAQPLGGGLPPRQLLIHGLRLMPDALLLRELGEDVALVAVTGADRHRLAGVG